MNLKKERKIKTLMEEKNRYGKELTKLIFPLGIFRKRNRKHAYELLKLIHLTDLMIKDLKRKI